MAGHVNPELVSNLTPHFIRRRELGELAYGSSRLAAMQATLAMLRQTHGARAAFSGFNKNLLGDPDYNLTLAGSVSHPTQYASGPLLYVKYLSSDAQFQWNNTTTGWNSESTGGSYYNNWGLTVFGWFRFTTLPASAMGLISNWNDQSNNAVYMLYKGASDEVCFAVSNGGSYEAANNQCTSTGILSTDTWYYIVGRWTPGTEVMVEVRDYNGLVERATNVASISSTLYEPGTPGYRLGDYVDNAGGHNYFNGDCCISSFGIVHISDEWLDLFWDVSRRYVIGQY